MSVRIFVTLSAFSQYDDAPIRLLERSGIPFDLNRSGKRITRDELMNAAQRATVVIAGVEPYDAAVLDSLPALRCISRCGVGVDSIDLEHAHRRGITVLNTPDPPAQAVAELALAMMLALARNLPVQAAHMRRREWTRVDAHLLGKRRVGVVGLGRIGRRVVELLTPFGSPVCAADPNADVSWAAAHGVRIAPLDELLATSDIVTLHAAAQRRDALRLDRAALARMRQGAILLNLARGGMVDEAALEEALASGHLSGAGLDVYSEEPYSGPLCDRDNVILTPHAATLTVETRTAMEIECVQNALAFISGARFSSDAIA